MGLARKNLVCLNNMPFQFNDRQNAVGSFNKTESHILEFLGKMRTRQSITFLILRGAPTHTKQHSACPFPFPPWLDDASHP